MTTIAYRDGIMAADSQITGSGLRRGFARKIHRLPDGGLLGCAGLDGFDEPIIAWVMATDRADLASPVPRNTEFNAILVRPDGSTFHVFEHEGRLALSGFEAEFTAVGSGNELAIGAMARGATAAEAVEVASHYDVHTGGQVLVERLHDGVPGGLQGANIERLKKAAEDGIRAIEAYGKAQIAARAAAGDKRANLGVIVPPLDNAAPADPTALGQFARLLDQAANANVEPLP